MYKKLFLILTVLFSILSFSNIYYIGITKESTEFNNMLFSNKIYIDVEEFVKFFKLQQFPSKNIVYLSNPENNDILELDLIKGTARVNFNINRAYSSAVISKDEKLYVWLDAIKDFFSLKSFRLNDDIFIYKSIPRVIKIEYSFNKIIFTLSHLINEKMLKIEKDGFLIFPAINEFPVPADIDYKVVSDNIIKYTIKNFESYDMTISKRSVIFTLNESKINPDENNSTDNKANDKTKSSKTVYKSNTKKSEESVQASPLEQKLNEIKNQQNTYVKSQKINNNQERITLDTELLKVENKMIDLNGRIIPVHIARINPKELEIKVLFNNLGSPEDAEKFLNKTKPLIAINAGYFDVSTLEPIGKIITEGKIQHISSYLRPCFILDNYGNPVIKDIVMEYKIYVKDVPFWIKAINTAWKGDVKLYTSEYKGKINESEDDYIFLLIENGYIVHIGKERPIKDQRLLLIDKKYKKYISDINEGDEVIFNIDINQKISIKEMVEGGPLVITDDLMQEALKEEKLAYSSSIINRKTPRTIVAIDNDNMVLFIVVDGYMESNPGINYDEAQLLLEKIGNIKQAMMLDGGSSSIFYYNGKVLNYRSENWRNKIPAFLGVFKKK
ncbi:phosphodiester glycosidase family protein [Marinitoga aeolica]|uniref:Phosphodiester glycosidase family protein n=1 Tax=Marinitoga aeolica TaxID=2809031 RepID=A0ABY8PRZ1_9BACT|nr:phosphodiester glycosidase family protein [Marinitoga aeolica]WGS65407.1 phosphodiester glycosidase family protein [Marinitoga aeolica]